MEEIGGYFGLEQFNGVEYHKDLVGVNSARNALLYILKARKAKKIYIPRFLCDSVSKMCLREGYLYEEYSINSQFLPVFDKPLGPDEYIYIVNFYGQLSNDEILDFKEKWHNIIIDNVQSFFQRPVSGVDTVYSCRKFFGVPDGGYVSTDAVFPYELDLDLSMERMNHILGRFEKSGTEYFADFQANDEAFYRMPLKKMSALTRNILRGVDYDAVRLKRNTNFACLSEALDSLNTLNLTPTDGPFCYPFYCEAGSKLKKELAKNKIFIPTLWPNILKCGNPLEKDLAEKANA